MLDKTCSRSAAKEGVGDGRWGEACRPRMSAGCGRGPKPRRAAPIPSSALFSYPMQRNMSRSPHRGLMALQAPETNRPATGGRVSRPELPPVRAAGVARKCEAA
ncbi:unnamed protein product [Pleuronectes platessa]|uniref:Uncharacterized protein n=1 Tax=Pleuronectes platessa TaxID=8262 RepID=A0A9N7YLB1_PLEPL|nr:unnamed protein product [Pleuronectes platessa]